MANSANSVRVAFEALRSLAFGSISGTYALVGTVFENPVRQLLIHNTTNANVIISYDGVTDHSFLAAGTSRVMDYCSNTSMQSGVFTQPARQGVYVKDESAATSSGNVYVEVVYASDN